MIALVMIAQGVRKCTPACASMFLSIVTVGCGSVEGTVAAGVGGTWVLSKLPNAEIEQVYYLGTFDDAGQVPPMLYRVTVRGQASAMSDVKFASGWVPSLVADALGTNFSFDSETGAFTKTAEERLTEALPSRRRLVQFGPEGFREAPKDHRLVLVMGSDPSAYFEAIDSALGEVANTQIRLSSEAAQGAVDCRERLIDAQRDALRDLSHAIELTIAIDEARADANPKPTSTAGDPAEGQNADGKNDTDSDHVTHESVPGNTIDRKENL